MRRRLATPFDKAKTSIYHGQPWAEAKLNLERSFSQQNHVLGVQFHPEAWPLYNGTYKARFTPQDREPFSFKDYLEKRPPSLDFHKKLWSWVSQAWVDQSRRR
jgi:hypothetical protein